MWLLVCFYQQSQGIHFSFHPNGWSVKNAVETKFYCQYLIVRYQQFSSKAKEQTSEIWVHNAVIFIVISQASIDMNFLFSLSCVLFLPRHQTPEYQTCRCQSSPSWCWTEHPECLAGTRQKDADHIMTGKQEQQKLKHLSSVKCILNQSNLNQSFFWQY